MRISYGWLDDQLNPAFRDRTLILNQSEPCILIGRNGSGKTLSSRIIQHCRDLLFSTNTSFDESMQNVVSIGLDWLEFEFSIPLVYVEDLGMGPKLKEKVAWDLVEDDFEHIWLSSMGVEMDGGWEPSYHAFNTDMNLKVRIKNIQSKPEMVFWYYLKSSGSLEIVTLDESLDFFEDTWHHGFTSDIREEIRHFDSKFPVMKEDPNSTEFRLWDKLVASMFLSGVNVEDLRTIYQKHFSYITSDLNSQCVAKVAGNPEIGDDELEYFDPGEKKNVLLDIIIESANHLFPPVIVRGVDRVAPIVEPWKKKILEELIQLRVAIQSIIDIDRFGLGMEIMLERLEEYDELRIPAKFKDLSKFTENKNRLEKLFDEHRSIEPWMKILPLNVQRRGPKTETLAKLAHDSKEFSREMLELQEYVNFVEEIIITMSECFPNYEDFKQSSNKYEILVSSITKFQNSGQMNDVYLRGILEIVLQQKDSVKQQGTKTKEKLIELSNYIPRYMLLHWYAFEEESEIIALFETYMRIFDDNTSDMLDQSLWGEPWKEFLHIIENTDFLPSGFSHLLSIVMAITESEDSCIIFIDEPEISLHIDWQRKLIDLLKFLMSESRKPSMLLIATHSPDIFMEHLDNVIDFSVQLNE